MMASASSVFAFARQRAPPAAATAPPPVVRRSLAPASAPLVPQRSASPTAAAPAAEASVATTPTPLCYALSDEDYSAWRKAMKECQKTPDSLEPLQPLADRPRLLNWRSPVSGQTLFHELAARGASDATLERAAKLGCLKDMPNSRGETAGELSRRLRAPKVASPPSFGADAGYRPAARASTLRQNSANLWRRDLDEEVEAPSSRPRASVVSSALRALRLPPTRGQVSQQTQQQMPPSSSMAQPRQQMVPRMTPWSLTAELSQAAPSMRKAGKKLQSYEVTSVPKAQMRLNLDFQEEADLDTAALERSIQEAYGGKVKVQIDAVDDSPRASSPAAACGAGGAASDCCRRNQKVRARVMFENEEECRTWQKVSNSARTVQQSVATSMRLGDRAVEFDAAAEMDSVDAVTLKLDSDSSSILCGACLLYNDRGRCEEVVCYSDRSDSANAVRHSGDTLVDGKSVHTIDIVMSKLPPQITQIYFTICSCGPEDLSGFKNPSIMLYSSTQPDENLLEYSIEQAANSQSSVMARMIRQPVWKEDDRAAVWRILRRLKMPLLCVDLCLAFAAETTFNIQALGTEEWNLRQKVCSNYPPAQRLIAQQLKGEGGGAVKLPVVGPHQVDASSSDSS